MRLNEIQIKNLKPQDKIYRKVDGDGLCLEIHPNGSKLWRVAYVFNGKRRQVALGQYPVVTLKAAREKRLEVKRLLDKGVDPVQAKRQEKLNVAIKYENNFEAIAREWHSQKHHTWQPKHSANILKRLDTYLFPTLGSKPIIEITPPELLHLIRPIEKAGKHEMSHRILQTVSQIFRYAVACGKADRDITQDLKGALKPVVSKNFAHLDEKQLPAFIETLNQYDLMKEDGGYNGNLSPNGAFNSSL